MSWLDGDRIVSEPLVPPFPTRAHIPRAPSCSPPPLLKTAGPSRAPPTPTTDGTDAPGYRKLVAVRIASPAPLADSSPPPSQTSCAAEPTTPTKKPPKEVEVGPRKKPLIMKGNREGGKGKGKAKGKGTGKGMEKGKEKEEVEKGSGRGKKRKREEEKEEKEKGKGEMREGMEMWLGMGKKREEEKEEKEEEKREMEKEMGEEKDGGEKEDKDREEDGVLVSLPGRREREMVENSTEEEDAGPGGWRVRGVVEDTDGEDMED